LGDNLHTALRLPIAGLHCDLVRAPAEIETIVETAPKDLVLSLGIVDGRNVWRADLQKAVQRVEWVLRRRAEESIILAPSCSLLHVPIDIAPEEDLDRELKSWLSFAVQKIEELVTIGRVLGGERQAVETRLVDSGQAAAARAASPRVHDRKVQRRLAEITPEMTRRHSAYGARKKPQQKRFALPLYPTTTIGSFPQTANIRAARAAHQKGTIDDAQYDSFLKEETEAAIHWQEEIGIDVLVHGEYERNDMVQYFGEQLAGYAFTKHGWVQSYGTRCVRPPIIFGDISRPRPMTIAWARYAQSLTDRPVKGMLTGPVTMLQWSFVRDDVARDVVCKEIALAIRDEVQDLESAGIKIIQIDEPAIREGLPLRKKDWDSYLAWAVACFRIASSGVTDDTQIHTHMCYSEFNDIIAAIAAMDADVISIETARSKMELLEVFTTYRYPNEIGPGVYDIHAPRVPTVDEIMALVDIAKKRLAADQIWVNPDCGLKTRSWEDVRPALQNMVAAARQLRAKDA
jgi:5-methyltetrahydropteroyltriglutamate--homocysteine methyltransferase